MVSFCLRARQKWADDGGAAADAAAFLDAFGARSACFAVARTALDNGQLPAAGDGLSLQDGGARELFLRRLYFSLVARMAAWRALTCVDERADPFVTPDTGSIAGILRGDWFAARGLENYPGRDGCLDSGLWRADCVSRAARAVIGVMAGFGPRALDGGALAALYQQLLSAPDRRGLGEFYTPEALAARIVARALAGRPDAAVCDPACGSGAFLAAAIREKQAQLGSGSAALERILRIVHGADVQPLAVLAAKTTYLLALGPLLAASGRTRLRLPVEQADLLDARGPYGHAPYHLVVGNPPWQPLRALRPGRQAALKRLAAEYGLLSGRGEMAPHLDLSALCVARAADRLLAPGGALAMVMPRTVLHADQHDALRRGIRLPDGGTLRWREVWDCERLDAFPVPACVLFAERVCDGVAQGPIVMEGPDGPVGPALVRLRLGGARSSWGADESSHLRSAASPYRARFRQGATLVPRSFWFVRAAGGGAAERGAARVAVETADTARAGPVAAYRGIVLRGCVPANRLFATALGDDLLPFGLRRLRAVLLSIESGAAGYHLMTAEDAHACGEAGLAEWLEEAERAWATARGEKAGRMTLYERLDRMRGLTAQNPRARFRVVYPNFQRIMAAAVVAAEDVRAAELDGLGIAPAGFVADTALYACETDDAGEAYYLCACLNAAAIDRRLGALRRRDQGSHPNVHKKPFDVAPIPRYDPSNAAHRRLAALAEVCAASVRRAVAERAPEVAGPVGDARRRIRGLLADKLAAIDEATEEVLSAEG